MSLNLHLLRLFIAVAEHRSFSRAAEALGISQPAVSKGVREFEAQVRNALFERGHREIRLTEAGRRLLKHSRMLFAAEQAAVEELDALHGLRGGSLRIGASTTIASYYLPPYLSAFHRGHPLVELRLRSANTLVVAEMLAEHQLDIALVEGPVDLEGLQLRPWREDKLVCVAAPSHPLARRGCVAPEDLADEILIVREQGSGTRDVVARAFSRAGVELGRTLEVGSGEAITHVVAAGLGISIVSFRIAENQIALGTLCVLEIEGLRISRTLTRLSLPSRPLSAAAVAFDHALDSNDLD
jgi:DNA-binding transcriptional LysR family regulator